ncbi:MAG: hypothetical protein KAT29_15235, partial [Anaerolineales bacterium]|nr:hypothetical protein [Anaerolineales bacterium]
PKQPRAVEIVSVGLDPLPKGVWFVDVSRNRLYSPPGIKQLRGDVTADISKRPCYDISTRDNNYPPTISSECIARTL